MGIATRHLGTLVIAAAGILAADSADAGWYRYEVQVHYTHYDWGSTYWAERATFSSEAEAKDYYFYLLVLDEWGYLDYLHPGARGYLSDDVRLVRFSNYAYDPYGAEWISGSYWRSLQPNYWYGYYQYSY